MNESIAFLNSHIGYTSRQFPKYTYQFSDGHYATHRHMNCVITIACGQHVLHIRWIFAVAWTCRCFQRTLLLYVWRQQTLCCQYCWPVQLHKNWLEWFCWSDGRKFILFSARKPPLCNHVTSIDIQLGAQPVPLHSTARPSHP